MQMNMTRMYIIVHFGQQLLEYIKFFTLFAIYAFTMHIAKSRLLQILIKLKS